MTLTQKALKITDVDIRNVFPIENIEIFEIFWNKSIEWDLINSILVY